jgi:organic hydroperoxide reductase OsmC/OhrA
VSDHDAFVTWTLNPDADFRRGHYGRAHRIAFDGGAEMTASAAPSVVGRWADPAGIDPEEMLVASVSSCHMLTFLDVARRAGFLIDRYADAARGRMGEVAPGRKGLVEVVLRPDISWVGPAPDAEALDALHEASHAACFIANSVKFEIRVEAPSPPAAP